MIRNSYKTAEKKSDNRLNIILAIIFLFAFAVFFKLYKVQVENYDYYTALASDQHQVFNKLMPARGQIFIQDSPQIGNSQLYPFATNKEFAQIYAIPDKVVDPKKAAEELYNIIDKKNVEKEADQILENDEYFKILETDGENEIQRKKEFREVKREIEIKNRKEKIIENYLKKLNKKNDPFEPLANKVSEEDLAKITQLNLEGIDYTMQTYRFYPENNIGSQLLGFVGFIGEDKVGQYGLEGFFDKELSGTPGSVKAERSAKGELIIINDREYNAPVDGKSLILTINRAIQYYACEKLNEAAKKHGADSGSVLVMEPKTGAIIAMCSYPDYDPNNYGDIEDINVYNNPVVFQQYEPGSIFKIITMAAALDAEKVTPETTYEDKGSIMIEGWGVPIKNSDFATYGGHGKTNMVEVLKNSLNTGAIFAMQQVGEKKFGEYIEKFGFGKPIGIELEGEATGDIKNLQREKIRPIEAATASFGQGITVTPLQVTNAFAAIANGGILMKPYLVSEIVSPDGTSEKTIPQQLRRVISERAALVLSGMAVKVVEEGHAKRAKIDGYYIAGKTGTAQVASKEKRGYSDATIHSFAGFGPVEDPRFVMLVKIDNPKDAKWAESTAVPLFGDISQFILNYYQVEKEENK